MVTELTHCSYLFLSHYNLLFNTALFVTGMFKIPSLLLDNVSYVVNLCTYRLFNEDEINLSQDKRVRQALVNVVMKIWVP